MSTIWVLSGNRSASGGSAVDVREHYATEAAARAALADLVLVERWRGIRLVEVEVHGETGDAGPSGAPS